MRRHVVRAIDFALDKGLTVVALWFSIFCFICLIGYFYDLTPVARFSFILELGYDYYVGASALCALVVLLLWCIYKLIRKKLLASVFQRGTKQNDSCDAVLHQS